MLVSVQNAAAHGRDQAAHPCLSRACFLEMENPRSPCALDAMQAGFSGLGSQYSIDRETTSSASCL